MSAHPGDPIFICGIVGRSGTNYLRDLLLLHPDCGAPRGVPEDFLLHHGGLLIDFAQSATGRWSDAGAADALLRALGQATIEELRRRTDGDRLVTKTPSVRNLADFDRVFCPAHVVVVVRDGRSVAESYVRSFGANYEGVFHRWAEAARTVLDATDDRRSSNRPLQVVRFEDLFTEPETTLRALFHALALDPTGYDFDAARRLPSRGSSEGRATAEGLHWRPVERAEGFDPTARWHTWSRRRHDRFNWIAGAEMERLGYEVVASGGSRRGALTQHLLDAGWGAADRLRLVPLSRHLVKRLGLQGRF